MTTHDYALLLLAMGQPLKSFVKTFKGILLAMGQPLKSFVKTFKGILLSRPLASGHPFKPQEALHSLSKSWPGLVLVPSFLLP